MAVLIFLIVALATASGWRLEFLPDWSPYAVMVLFAVLAIFARVIAKIIITGLIIGLFFGLVPVDLQDIGRALGF